MVTMILYLAEVFCFVYFDTIVYFFSLMTVKGLANRGKVIQFIVIFYPSKGEEISLVIPDLISNLQMPN